MDLGQIISNSFTYPFKDLKRLVIVCVLFVFPLILPIGVICKSDIAIALGIIFLLVFILIIPGYTVAIVKNGISVSNELPSFKIGRSIVNTIKLILLRIVYMIIPVAVFLISLFVLVGSFSTIFSADFNAISVISTFATVLIVSYIVYFVFEFLLIFARARLAYYDSLVEALKIHKVIRDIINIGIGRVIGWYIVMAILLGFISFICILLLLIPYIGLAIYVCIALPIMLIINYYSLGLLYSNIAKGNLKDDSGLDLDEFEREVQRLKYRS